MMDAKVKVNTDCRFYKGHIPCVPHKEQRVVCESCSVYEKVNRRILIIKLGAAGDVIRTTPLLERLRREYPESHITWLTQFMDFVPKTVDSILPFKLESVLTLLGGRFDILINLDKDHYACSLASMIKAKKKKGFLMEDGLVKPADGAAAHKWLTGLFDNLNRENTKSYLTEIFEICGFTYEKEKYQLDFSKKNFLGIDRSKLTVGLNTGCGDRWPTRLWSDSNWLELADRLTLEGFQVIFLGGPAEDEKNKRMAMKSKQEYLGVLPLTDFVSLIDNCDLLVTGVSMAMHIGLALENHVVVLNNIFNKHEFEMFGLGEVIEPEGLDCLGCFRGTCEKEKCMDRISSEAVFKVCMKYLRRKVKDKKETLV